MIREVRAGRLALGDVVTSGGDPVMHGRVVNAYCVDALVPQVVYSIEGGMTDQIPADTWLTVDREE